MNELPPLTGDYSGIYDEKWSMGFNLELMPVDHVTAQTPSYLPYHISGMATLLFPGSTHLVYGAILAGVYDLFTGSLRLNLDSEQIFLGKLSEKGITGAFAGGYVNHPLRAHRTVEYKNTSWTK